MRRAIAACEALGKPWGFAWGNHDTVDDYAAAHRELAGAKNSLYRGGAHDGNYAIEIVGRHGKPKMATGLSQYHAARHSGKTTPVAAGVHGQARPPQGDGPIPAFVLFHIPVRQYDLIWQNGSASGIKMETVCSEQEDGSSLELLRSFGNVRACFCGHDHVNDYYSAILDGIELVYGRATGYGSYGRERVRKGAKLITVNCETGRYAWGEHLHRRPALASRPGNPHRIRHRCALAQGSARIRVASRLDQEAKSPPPTNCRRHETRRKQPRQRNTCVLPRQASTMGSVVCFHSVPYWYRNGNLGERTARTSRCHQPVRGDSVASGGRDWNE